MMTRNGVEHDLKESPYILIMNYGKEETIEYRFSSKLHKLKFMKFFESNRIQNKDFLKRKYGISIYINELADINLYRSLESRGFYILSKGVEYRCLQDIIITENGLRQSLKI